MSEQYDLLIIGAGSGGLTAARFAAQLGAKVALVEKERIGGDCTWSGCVPGKALRHAARIAHQARIADRFGIAAGPVQTDMKGVRRYVRQAIARVYRHETPEVLTRDGIEVIFGAAQFVDAHTLRAGERTLSARKFLIATGAHPYIPPIPGLRDVPFLTYLQIFDNTTLPDRLLVIGAGPVGVELAHAYQRLGAQVTLVDERLLPAEEPDVAAVMGRVLTQEGLQFVPGLVSAIRREGAEIVAQVAGRTLRGDMLLVATGRRPNTAGLGLERVGVAHSADGIFVDGNLRTSARHIFAAGDCVAGNLQFTHVAGWQAFQAARNALLPGRSDGFSPVVPYIIFTDPEIAHVGLSEAEARRRHGDKVRVTRWNLNHVDRAIAEDACDGFFKVTHTAKGRVLGATIVAERAGEVITEFALAMQHNLTLKEIAAVIHPYPTYSIGAMMLAAEVATRAALNGLSGKILRGLTRL